MKIQGVQISIFLLILISFLSLVLPRREYFSANDWGGVPEGPCQPKDLENARKKIEELQQNLEKARSDAQNASLEADKRRSQRDTQTLKDAQERVALAETSMQDALKDKKKAETEAGDLQKKFSDCDVKLSQQEPTLTKARSDLMSERARGDQLQKEKEDLIKVRNDLQGKLNHESWRANDLSGQLANERKNLEVTSQNLRNCEKNLQRRR